MNNDLSRITPETSGLPYCIWYPGIPKPATCRELVRRAPSMKPAVAMVCILADYSDVWDVLDVDPGTNLMENARESHNSKHLDDLQSKIPQRGCRDLTSDRSYASVPRRCMFEPSEYQVQSCVTSFGASTRSVPYNGYGTSMAYVELFVAAPDAFREGNGTDLEEYYDSLA